MTHDRSGSVDVGNSRCSAGMASMVTVESSIARKFAPDAVSTTAQYFGIGRSVVMSYPLFPARDTTRQVCRRAGFFPVAANQSRTHWPVTTRESRMP